jgi:hypothetical protein
MRSVAFSAFCIVSTTVYFAQGRQSTDGPKVDWQFLRQQVIIRKAAGAVSQVTEPARCGEGTSDRSGSGNSRKEMFR